MRPMRILFVVGGASQTVGGHVISSITLANYTYQRNYDVGLLLSPLKSHLPELDRCRFPIYYKDCLPFKGAILNRPWDILEVVRKYRYQIIVAMDWYAAMYAGLASVCGKIPVIQVIAGGKGPPSSPLNLPGIVVFSEELMQSVPEKYQISGENFILSRGDRKSVV